MQIRTYEYNAENVFELLYSHYQELTLNGPIEIQKQRALEEAEEPEPKEGTMMASKLTEGFRLIEAGIKMF
jgi:hypothetical protein